jgi:hypothetical protein
MNTLHIQQQLQREHGHGERLLWSGMPRQGLRLHWADAFIIPFMLVWMAIPLVGALTSLKAGKGLISVLFVVPFLLVGAYMLIGRYVVDARQRARTFYGLTNQRVLILTTGRTRRATSLSLKSLADITFSEHRDGKGTLQFGSDRWPGAAAFGAGWPGMSQYVAPRFDLPANARQVYELLRKAQAEAS